MNIPTMKTLGAVLLLLFFYMPLSMAQTGDISRIEFSTTTRGYHKEVTVTSKTTVIKIEDRRQEGSKAPREKKTGKKEWRRLLASLGDVSLPELPLLKSPTQARVSDGARSSSLSITTTDGVIWSHEFDNETPHEKLQKLMAAIQLLEKD